MLLFPTLYHAHHTRHAEDLPFWTDLARQTGGPILELGCGTGRVLLPLAQAGFTVFGFDHDPEMLAFLRALIPPNLQDQLRIFEADLTAFHLAQLFGLIILPCNTYSTLQPEGRQAMLACVRQHLRPEGLFTVSLPNPRLLRQLPAHSEAEVEETFPHPVDGAPVEVSSAWERTDREFQLYWTYDHWLPGGKHEFVRAEIRHTLTPTRIYLDEIRAAGLEVGTLYGDFDRSAFNLDSDNLIIVARAPAG